jgi:signal transduction histidine kinase
MGDSTVTDLLSALATHLHDRREEVLSSWRRAVDLDPTLTSGSAITRVQFIDHIPAVLDAFERRLCAEDSAEKAEALHEEWANASEHGMQRWQQGYNLAEAMCEWGHLHLALLHEIERYAAHANEMPSSVMIAARRALVRLCSDGVCASATRYAQLQQSDAATRLRDLESALTQVQALERQRAEAWREASHDLRGSTHVIATASAVLNRTGITESRFTQYSEILRVEVASLSRLVTDLMDQARLEAGHERRNVVVFDAAKDLREFSASMRPDAEARGLFLKATGPESLVVEGDPVKIRRILQNLVSNALKATDKGGIQISWDEGTGTRAQQWMLCVQDTGPGLAAHSITPIEHALKQATTEVHAVEDRAEEEGLGSANEPAATLASQTVSPAPNTSPGEGIGLSIVKRLCELLDASIELETAKGEGTTFRVAFPRQYGQGPQ